MKIIVTGGAGFLGYHISQKINRITNFNECVFFDIAEFETGEYDKDIKCIYGDVRDKKQMDEITKDVLHKVAVATPTEHINDLFCSVLAGVIGK